MGAGTSNISLINIQYELTASSNIQTVAIGARSSATVSNVQGTINENDFLNNLYNSSSSWYQDSLGNLRLAAPGSKFVSYYKSGIIQRNSYFQ